MGLHPNLMMDRQKACVPALQIEFLDTVVTPTFEILLNIFPESSKFLETIETNKQHWEDLKTNVIKAQKTIWTQFLENFTNYIVVNLLNIKQNKNGDYTKQI